VKDSTQEVLFTSILAVGGITGFVHHDRANNVYFIRNNSIVAGLFIPKPQLNSGIPLLSQTDSTTDFINDSIACLRSASLFATLAGRNAYKAAVRLVAAGH
jgi:hypothetical protein